MKKLGFFEKIINSFKGNTVYISGAGTRSRPRDITIENNDICSAILDCNATHIARGNVLHVKMEDGQISKTKRNSAYTKLFSRPNLLMTGKDFIYSMAWQLQISNMAFAWVKWDRMMQPIEIWPLIYLRFELREKKSGGYAVQFTDADGMLQVVDVEDLVVIRRKFDGVGFVARGNSELRETLEVSVAIDEALKQASEISNKLSGILKQKKAMLSSNGTAEASSDAGERIRYAAEHGGILSVDAMEDYTPISPTTWTSSAAQAQMVEGRIHKFWRTPNEVVNNTASEQVMQNYYDSIVEPAWEVMGEAFSRALFTDRELDRGERIIFTTGAATGASWQTKINIVNNTKELGLLTINEYRELMGYGPVEDGDKRMVSLNYVDSELQSEYQLSRKGENSGKE